MITSVNTGNFTVKVSGSLKPAVQEKIISNGVLYDLQRGGLTGAYNALGGVENDKGKVRLPDGFTRDTVEFNDENAATMQEIVEKWAGNIFEDGDCEITVTKYEGSEAASPMKRATALVDSFLGTDAEAAYRTILGSDGDRDALIAEANKRGLGIQPPKAPKA